MSLSKLSLGGNYDVIYKLFLPRGSLVSDIPAGDGNIEKLFYGVCTDLDDECELGVLLVPVPQVLPAYTFQSYSSA
jgi:hypothetical protein